jgi:hypothetical protein
VTTTLLRTVLGLSRSGPAGGTTVLGWGLGTPTTMPWPRAWRGAASRGQGWPLLIPSYGTRVARPRGHVPAPAPFPRPGRLARRVGGVNGGACAIAKRRRKAPLTPATRRGRFPAEGAVTPNPRILRPW